MPASTPFADALADRYRIERELGAGGMATVYLAEDVRHRRRVALKVLHPELSAVIGSERFLKEIELTANLQHPHILPLFDSGEVAGQLFYVMPYVEGETLRARLERERQLPIADAVQLAREVADALHYAHERGVIHRDIKPENVLLQGGHALVADFGIALAVQQAGGGRMTQTGISLGTPQYMAPEQATGERTVDARADVYSLAAVLYEMIAGEPPFTAPTMQGVIAKLMTETPRALETLRRSVPMGVAAAVHEGLEKLPADRTTTARAFADALVNVSGSTRTAATPRGNDGRRLVLASGAALVAMTGLAGWVWTRAGASASGTVYRFSIELPPGAQLADALGSPITLSPDGRRIVFRGSDSTGKIMLFARDLGSERVDAVPGTENALRPTFSADGQWLQFTASGPMRVPAGGGTRVAMLPHTLSETGRGAEGDVLVSTRPQSDSVEAWLVGGSAEGARLLWRRQKKPDDLYLFPSGLPQGGGVFTLLHEGDAEVGEIGVISPEGEMTMLGIAGTGARYVAPGYLVWGVKGRGVMVAPFDARSRRVTGAAVNVLPDAHVKAGGALPLAVADDGTVVYLRGAASASLVLETPAGRQVIVNDDRMPGNPRFSPDGRRIAFDMEPASAEFMNNGRDILSVGLRRDIWVYDIPAATLSRITTEGGSHAAEWSPDGAWLFYTAWLPDSSGGRRPHIRRVRSDGSAQPQRVAGAPAEAFDVVPTPDGSSVIVRSGPVGVANAFHLVSLRDTSSRVLLEGPSLNTPTVSPDGQWLAYSSGGLEDAEVFVRAFPSMEGRLQVSRDGGTQPRWADQGRSLLHRQGNTLVSASLTLSGNPSVSARRTVLEDPDFGRAGNIHHQYDVRPDGRTRVAVRGYESRRTMHVIVGWMSEVAQLVKAR